MKKKKIVIALGGSSGSIYAKVLLDKLKTLSSQIEAVGIVMSDNAFLNWEYELGEPFDKAKYEQTGQNTEGVVSEGTTVKFYHKMDFFAPFASGSAKYDTMIVCPCSMGLLARIATGVSNDLVTRAADVILKERRRLILVPRDTPFSLIHLRNMTTLTESGAVICPAMPSFYSRPTTFEALAATVIDRVLDLAGLDLESYRWSE
ncbi:MAG: UbiX family flavin prenyltransferase [Saprospiraceae bacterium]|nr:UbiX family flavin prenyltransferase [Saprospiraceae bacterium]